MELRIVFAERLVRLCKRLCTPRRLACGIALATVIPLGMLVASERGSYGLWTFEAGTPIRAAEVNDNFEALGDHMVTYEDAISIDGAGNVGVGTSNPNARLEVAGENTSLIVRSSAPEVTAGLFAGNTGGGPDRSILYSSGMLSLGAGGATHVFIEEDGDVQLSEGYLGDRGSRLRVQGTGTDSSRAALSVEDRNATSLLYVRNDGNIGVGTMTPEASLTLGPSRYLGWNYSESDHNVLHRIGHDANDYRLMFINNSGDADHDILYQFMTNAGSSANTPVLSILRGGNVGIGTATPETALDVAGYVQAKGDLLFNSVDPQVRVTTNSALRFMTNGINERMRIDNIGNVGINTTAPAYRLDVDGQVRAANISVTSDIRLKTDIMPLKDALHGVECLQGVSYRLLEPERTGDTRQIGLIAQDVETCFPEVVSTDGRGYKSVSYDRLVAPLIEAVKEQQAALGEQGQVIVTQGLRLEAQERRIEEQHKELARLKTAESRLQARLDRLEALTGANR